MPLCSFLRDLIAAPSSAGDLLSLVGGVQRMVTESHVAFLIECRAKGCSHAIHRIDIPVDEIDSDREMPPLSEFYAWVLRVHAPREQKKAMEASLAQTPKARIIVLQEVPKPVVVESKGLQTPWPATRAA